MKKYRFIEDKLARAICRINSKDEELGDRLREYAKAGKEVVICEKETRYLNRKGLTIVEQADPKETPFLLAVTQDLIEPVEEYTDFTKYPVGTKVWCYLYGDGIIERVGESYNEFPITIKFDYRVGEKAFSFDGRYYKSQNVSLFLGDEPEWFKQISYAPSFQPVNIGDLVYFYLDDGTVGVPGILKDVKDDRYIDEHGRRFKDCIAVKDLKHLKTLMGR